MARVRRYGPYTANDLRLVEAVASDPDGLCETKAALADRLGLCVRTVDRCVRRLRDAGVIEVEPLNDDDGRTLCNAYTLAGPVPPELHALREESRCPREKRSSSCLAPIATA